MEWMDAPVLKGLSRLAGRAWLHMPGHGGHLPWMDAAFDTTELPVSDDLHQPEAGGFFEEAQALYAKAAGAESTLFLAGGSTLGVQAMLLAFVPPGGKVILPRDAHRAAFSACAIGDLTPICVYPRWEEGAGRAFLHPEDVAEGMRAHPDAAAVLLTHPDYYGVCMDVRPVAEAAKRLGMALLVDEAHGAHFPWGGEGLSAGIAGADAWTHSAHKTLPALTQSALLHLKEKRNEAAVRRVVHMLGSSSPSFLLTGSVDYARAAMRKDGQGWIQRAAAENRALLDRLAKAGYGDSHALWQREGRRFDTARLVIEVSPRGLTGFAVQKALTRAGVDIEMADERRIVCIPPLPGAGDALARLEAALAALPKGGDEPPPPLLPFADTRRAVSIRQAAFSAAENVMLRHAQGRTAAEAVGAYPPGIPFLAPGEAIEGRHVEALLAARAAGARLFGVTDERIAVMEV